VEKKADQGEKDLTKHMVTTMKKLMEATMKKLANLAPDIEVVPRKRYTGYKLNGRLLSSILGKKLFFDMSIHEYSEDGKHVGTKHSEIRFGRKNVGAVINGLVKKVKKNYDILTEANGSKKKVVKKAMSIKKETFAESTIVEEVPIKETLKETKKGA